MLWRRKSHSWRSKPSLAHDQFIVIFKVVILKRNITFLTLRSLGSALGWTVDIIEVWSDNGGASESRSLRAAVKTLVSFISVDGREVVSSEEVTK